MNIENTGKEQVKTLHEEIVEQYAQSIQDMYFLAGAKVSVETWNNTKDIIRNAHTTLLTEIRDGVESNRKWADEATPEQQNNIDTYNEAITDILTLLDTISKKV